MNKNIQTPRPIIFGEVLFDCFPDGTQVLGGAPFNVAWHLRGFELNPLFISRVGEDTEGEKINAAMSDWGMDLQGLQKDSDHPTGSVQISLENGQPSYEIVTNQAYDHITRHQYGQLNGGLIYHGSLALRDSTSRQSLEQLIKDSYLPIFLDINLREPWWKAEDLPLFIQRATWIKLNDEELAVIAPLLGITASDPVDQAQAMAKNHALDWVILTLGAGGAVAINEDGKYDSIQPEGEIEIVDTVGAGDAFTAVVICGLLSGWPLHILLQRAQAFASRVCGWRGATRQDTAQYQEVKNSWSKSD